MVGLEDGPNPVFPDVSFFLWKETDGGWLVKFLSERNGYGCKVLRGECF